MSTPLSAPPRRRSWWVVLAAGVALVLAAVVGAFLVFEPSASVPSTAVQRLAGVLVDRMGLPWHTASDVVEFVLNIALFVPGALAAAMLWPRVRWWQWVLVGFAITASIETLQGVFLAGRNAQARDLVANTLGAAVGAGAGVLWNRRRPSS